MKKKFFSWLLDLYKSRKQRANNETLDHAWEVIGLLLKKHRYGFLISNGTDGWSSSRLVQPVIETTTGNIRLWIGTSPESRKVEEIWGDPRITMAFGGEKHDANLVMYGHASIRNDDETNRKYWKSMWRLFFPKGPSSKDYLSICFEPERIEVLSFSHSIVPEPFGLKPLLLERADGVWQVAVD